MACFLVLGAAVTGPAITLASAPPEQVETGQPPFAILDAEQLGLASSPEYLRLLSDGRLLVVADRQLAIGDGVRWEVLRAAESQAAPADMGVAIDPHGTIYLASMEGLNRVRFTDEGSWRLVQEVAWPADSPSPDPAAASAVPAASRPWLWNTLTGPVYAWHPGEPVRMIASGNTIESTFWHRGDFYLSERGNGRLSRHGAGGIEVVSEAGSFSAITCVQPFDEERLLVGTYGAGLQWFDGQRVQPFPQDRVFSGGARINDLCALPGGQFAAAVDNLGLVFFDRTGRVQQTIDRRADQRLARVKRLVTAPGGVIWGLLDGGVVRVEYPSALSRFEPMLGAGLTTVHPFRIKGRLWFLSDGRVHRGQYGAESRLENLDLDSPPQRFVNSLSDVDGLPVAGTEDGAFLRDESGWRGFAPEVRNLRVLDSQPIAGRWLYTARGEAGWIEQTAGGGLRLAERIPVAGLTNAFNRPVRDGKGRYWLELGSGRIGLVEVVAGRPHVTLLTTAQGLPGSWPQTFELDGEIGFNFNGQLFAYDEASGRLVADGSWTRRLPPMGEVFGRPVLDPHGRLWLVADGQIQVWEQAAGKWRRSPLAVNAGFLPYYFVFEENGVAWLHAQHRFARFDPARPAETGQPLQAMIIRVIQGRRHWIAPELPAELPPVPSGADALEVHFLARGAAPAEPVSFEVKLEGSGRDWAEAGASGRVRFEQLREGSYLLRVRPRAGGLSGGEATLGLAVLPPWHRTTLAYVAFGAGGLGVAGLLAWLLTWLLRRDRQRLETLVGERTLALQQSNEQLAWRLQEIRLLSEAIEQSPVAVFVTRADGVIEYANARAGSLTGWLPAQLVGRALRSLRGDASPAGVLEEQAAAIQGGRAWSGQLANRHADGRTVHLRSHCTPLRGPDGRVQHFVVLEEDITVPLAEEERRRRLEDQLLQSQKMETIGQLAGGVAHDLNNMLQAITGFATVAQQADVGAREREDFIHEILGAARRATEVTRQLLTFSRQQQVELKPVDLAALLANLQRLLRRLIGENIAIEFAPPATPVFALCDPTQVEQVLINLCVNARDAMPRGGTIVLEIAACRLDEEFVGSNPWARAGDFTRITVRDTGTGMDEAVIDRIFEPFFSTKPKDKGTGLGLSVVYGIVIQHKGLIKVDSQPGRGTTFLVYLPTADAAEQPATVSRPASDRGTETILVAEDDPSVRSLAERVLGRAGYRVLVAKDGVEAVELFRRHRDEIALLIFDCVMPQVGGLDAYQQIGAPLPVIFCTGYSEEMVTTNFGLPANARLLQKPYELSVLLQTVRQALDATLPR